MNINDLQCRTAKPLAKPYKMHDSESLFFKIMPNGSKYWRLKYRLFGKEKEMSLGVYPEISLLQARTKRTEAREKVRQGLDPVLVRLEERQTAAFSQEQIFEKMALEWHGKQIGHWSPKHAQTVLYRVERYIFL